MPSKHVATAVAAAAISVVTTTIVWLKRRGQRIAEAVGDTARIVAAARAAESEREDGLFRDPFAAILAGPSRTASLQAVPEQPQASAATEGKPLAGRIALRTRFIDDGLAFLLGAQSPLHPPAAQQHWQRIQLSQPQAFPPAAAQIRQVVLVGAGMDTRAWRLQVPAGTQWFEIDQPSVLDAKGDMIALATGFMREDSIPDNMATSFDSNPYHPIGVDISNLSALPRLLRAAGFDSSVSTLWVLEGLLYYLPGSSVQKLWSVMAKLSGRGSVCIASMVSRRSPAKHKAPPKQRSVRKLFKWRFPPTIAQDMLRGGWRVVNAMSYQEIAYMYGRTFVFTSGGVPVEQVSRLTDDDGPQPLCICDMCEEGLDAASVLRDAKDGAYQVTAVLA